MVTKSKTIDLQKKSTSNEPEQKENVVKIGEAYICTINESGQRMYGMHSGIFRFSGMNSGMYSS